LKVLLVGGAGFMGSRAARLLREAGHRVTVLSRGRLPLPAGIEALVADRRDPVALASALERRRFDFTVDFVAYDTDHVESLLRLPGFDPGRYVLISTGQVYLVTLNERTPCPEESDGSPLRPEPQAGTEDHAQWSYGIGKRRAESALLALRTSDGVRGVILRLPIVQGEGDPSLRLWGWLERMLDGGPVLVPDGGTWPLRFLYAGDVAQALRRLLDDRPLPRTVYNLAQPDILSLREFLERVARTAGLVPRFVDVPWKDLERAGVGRWDLPYSGPWSSVLDPARATGEWGFAGTPVDDYLQAVVGWHLEHRPPQSHHGYAARPRELALAERLATRSSAT
jgi:nucleoside-diphosphate-sugar epimerase